MIRAVQLSKNFGDHQVLAGIDVAIQRGERVAVLGLNGAGKTTFIRCVLGLAHFEGRLEVAGFDVRAQGREARALLGYVPQRAPHFDGTLAEVVEFFSRLRDADPDAVGSRLAAFGLPLTEHGDQPIRTLSGGMLQKALLALALGAHVQLLLLDEPTANLDPRARRDFLRTLRRVDRDTTILLASHRLADVDAVADRLLVLHGGCIAFDGKMNQLWQRAGADVTLWMKVPPTLQSRAQDHLRSRCSLATVLANGAALGVQVERGRRADVLAALRSAGIPVEDFWTEAPPLEDLLERVLGLHALRSGGAAHQGTALW